MADLLRIMNRDLHNCRRFAVQIRLITLCSGLFQVPGVANAAEVVDKARAHFPGGPLSTGNLVQMTGGLLLVVLMILALAWFLRRYGRFQSSAKGALKVVGGLSLGARERVVLLQVEDRQLLLGVAPGRVQMLHAFERREQPPETEQDDAAREHDGGFFPFTLKRG